MKCSNCGQEIANDSNFCEHCGSSVEIMEQKASVSGIIVSFLIPLVGFILYGTSKRKKSTDAKKYLWWAIVGCVVSIILQIVAASL